jgi:hypothetical protein
MCDPSILGIASSVSGIFDAFGQQSAQKRQEEEYNKWMKTQDANRAEENVTQEKLRQQAEAGRAAGVNRLSMGRQAAQQNKEQGRLTSYLDTVSGADKTYTADIGGGDSSGMLPGSAGSDTLTPVSDKFLAGQGDVAKNDPQFLQSLAGGLNKAASDARGRIAKLATLSSFGGSSGGLGQFSDEALRRAGYTVEQINNFRNGEMEVYGAKQKVDPLQIVYTPGLRF